MKYSYPLFINLNGRKMEEIKKVCDLDNPKECDSFPNCLGCNAYKGSAKELEEQMEEGHFGRYYIPTGDEIKEMQLKHEAYLKLEPYQQRMVEEYSELIKRYEKLKVFMTTETWYKLPSDEQQDMWYQFHAMNIYRMALRSRLDRAHIAEIFFPSPACAG